MLEELVEYVEDDFRKLGEKQGKNIAAVKTFWNNKEI